MFEPIVKAVIGGTLATSGFVVGFCVAILIAQAINGRIEWKRSDVAATAIVTTGFVALFWIIALGSAFVRTPWS